MAVHVPLSIEAQVEARALMMSTNNILSPANGKPIIVPSQDIILGLYYITMIAKNYPNSKAFAIADEFELEHALNQKIIGIHDKILYRYVVKDNDGERRFERVETTPGRVAVFNTLPKSMKNGLAEVNKVMTKKAITNLIDLVYRNCGQKETVIFCDRVMALGFKNACIAGTKTGLLYKEQPNGGQKSPDFHLINGTHILNFELKKSNTNIIMWNDGFPHRDTLYLISCKDFTRLCSGKSLATDEEIEMYNKQRELISIMNKTLKTQNKKNRINFYTRRANSQKIEPANINSDLLDCYPLLSKLIN